MKIYERLGLAVLHRLEPEKAHELSLRALQSGFLPLGGVVASKRCKVTMAGITFQNPVGLAAGYDKNALALDPLMRAGFGFLEVGAATPHPQPGNPTPRLFRLMQDRGIINRFGFNNDGSEAIAQRLAARPAGIPVGINLGANKDSTNKSADFASVLAICGPHVDFATVNISSPNTEKLRELQGRAALSVVLSQVMEQRAKLDRYVPIFLKIAPDLTQKDLEDITEVAMSHSIDAIIATNTTLSRDGLISSDASQAGGLSGAPLFEKSTRVIAQLSLLTTGRLPIIGVGGIESAEQAYAKICAGASLVQIYSGMVYHGLSLGRTIATQLDKLLKKDSFSTMKQAIGSRRQAWL
ncbi:MAG: dihydroorotate dehydrogenase [Paracoccaceae bacterium]